VAGPLPLTPTRTPPRSYKGRAARNEGTHTNLGGYVVRPARLMRIVAPSPAPGFDLKPYVHMQVRKPAAGQRVPAFAGAPAGGAPEELR